MLLWYPLLIYHARSASALNQIFSQYIPENNFIAICLELNVAHFQFLPGFFCNLAWSVVISDNIVLIYADNGRSFYL